MEEVSEKAQIGQTIELEADTKYANLSSLNTHRIYYKLPGQATTYLEASIVSGEPTKLEATLASEANMVRGKMRVWSYARGAGTIVMKGRRRFITIEDPELD